MHLDQFYCGSRKEKVKPTGRRRAVFAGRLLAVFAFGSILVAPVPAQETPISTYGLRNDAAPAELGLFSFLVGKWQGLGRARLEDGSHAEFDVTWIGRYVLDGMAMADEFHSVAPDGSPYLGISIRHFDSDAASRIIEYLNVSNSFVRRQVNARCGSVESDRDMVVVTTANEGTISRERYRLIDDDHFEYAIDLSDDRGLNWSSGSIEINQTRAE